MFFNRHDTLLRSNRKINQTKKLKTLLKLTENVFKLMLVLFKLRCQMQISMKIMKMASASKNALCTKCSRHTSMYGILFPDALYKLLLLLLIFFHRRNFFTQCMCGYARCVCVLCECVCVISRDGVYYAPLPLIHANTIRNGYGQSVAAEAFYRHTERECVCEFRGKSLPTYRHYIE